MIVDKFVKMSVDTGKQYLDALMIAQNAFYNRAEITVYNKNQSFSSPETLVENIKEGAKVMFVEGGERFSNAQLSGYSLQMKVDPFGRYCKVDLKPQYMCTEKQFNDFTCCSAEIGELLNKKASRCKTTYEKILVFDKWVKSHFSYQDKHEITDHSAIHLLQSRSGVCQAIAALAVKVLPFMGIETVYISGMGKGNQEWGRHSWNAVRIGNVWVHVDFTFSLNSLVLPSTKTELEAKKFQLSHRWDLKKYSKDVLFRKCECQNTLQHGEIKFIYNSKIGVLQGVQIESRSPVIMKKGNRQTVDILELIRLLGGACELVPNQDAMYICFGSQRIRINKISSYIVGSSFDIRILNKIGKVASYSNGIGFRIIERG